MWARNNSIKSINTKHWFGWRQNTFCCEHNNTGVTPWNRTICIYTGEAIWRWRDRSSARARRRVCVKGNGGGCAPGTANRRDAATALGGPAARPRRPTTPLPRPSDRPVLRSPGVASVRYRLVADVCMGPWSAKTRTWCKSLLDGHVQTRPHGRAVVHVCRRLGGARSVSE